MRKHLIFLVVILSSAMALITPGVALGQKTVLANYNPTQDNYAIDIPKFIACLREVGLEQNWEYLSFNNVAVTKKKYYWTTDSTFYLSTIMYDSVKGISAYALLQMASTSDASELFLQGKGPWIAIEYACLNPDCVLTFNSREYIGCRCKETGDPEGCDSRSRYYNLPPSED